MHLNDMGSVWLRRFAVLVACCTFLLVIAGGLVTSNDAALSVPDWPLAWGRLIPPLEGGIVYEFGHRVVAATVGLMTLALAIWMHRAEPRAWVRRLGWMAVGTVAAQVLLGGVVVKFVDPKWASVSHACLGQLFFGVTIVVAQALRCGSKGQAGRPTPLLAAAAIFVQTILGAAVRHNAAGLLPHVLGAGVATIAVMWASLPILMAESEEDRRRRPAVTLLSLTFSQVVLGMGAYISRLMTADAPQPVPLMVWMTVAHVAVGSLAFGAALHMGTVA